MDGLRFYTNENNEQVLFEEWFHCTDLGKQLKPVIEKFFNSEAHKTGRPTEDSVQSAPFQPDCVTQVDAPQKLSDLLQGAEGKEQVSLFDKGECKVYAISSSSGPTKRDVEVCYVGSLITGIFVIDRDADLDLATIRRV